MRVVAFGLLAIAGVATAAPVRDSSTTVHPGIVHETWSDAAIPAVMHVVRIDLTSSEIAVHATAEADKGRTTTSFAGLGDRSAVAINGGAFAVSGFRPRGLAMGASAVWSQTADDDRLALLHVRRVGERTLAAIAPPEEVTTLAALPAGTEGVVSGTLLVRASTIATPFDCDDPYAIACVRAPRTAAGVSADGNAMIVVVVDGWRTASTGMRADELATFIRARGANDAVMLDSGASSTLVLDGDLTNVPSDGAERAVANHLGIRYGALAKGIIYGVICRDSLSGCTTEGSPLRETDATVTLDDGRMLDPETADCPGGPRCAAYEFGGVTPRLACVTVRKNGYRTANKCVQVVAGQFVFNSIVLFAGTDPPDAGVPEDASETPIDGDPGTGTDGGPGLQPPGGDGCCDAGGTPSPLALLLVALTGGLLTRRRGTYGKRAALPHDLHPYAAPDG